jgi:23S rRNA (adenine2503-C2)-methyltransferase
MKQNLFGLFLDEISNEIYKYGLETYRAKQIAEWIYKRNVFDFSAMSNLSKKHRSVLSEHFYIGTLSVKAEQHSTDAKTSKFLLRLKDGNAIETVLMRQPYGNSVCVSTQVGCAMGCSFCASTLSGMIRNLSADEILNQVFYINRLLQGTGGVNTIVIMGSGEPLLNYEQVLRFIRLCHEEYIFHLSYRNITLSTSGIVPGVDRLSEEGLPLNLSISLHAPNNEIRNRLMPVNHKYPIEEVLAAADRYARKTGRRVTYEYTLIKDINDQPKHADELAALVRGQLASINLIPVNPVSERGMLRPGHDTIMRFENILQTKRIQVTVRREMGSDIQAACGQLRNKALELKKE